MRRASRWLAGLAVVVELIIIVGWLLHIELAFMVLPSRPAATIAGTFGGVGLALAAWLVTGRPGAARRRIAVVLATLALVLAGVVLMEHATALDFGIDSFFEGTPGVGERGIPGRASFPAALTLFLLALSVLLLDVRPGWRVRPAEVFAALGGLIAYAGLAAHAYGAAYLYIPSPDSLTAFAIPLALALFLTAGGLLLARPERGAAAAFAAPLAGGYVARRLALAAVGVPLLLGVLVVFAEGFLDSSSALALIAVTSSLLGLVLLFLFARDLNAADVERERGVESARLLASVVAHTDDAVIAIGLDRRVKSWNAAAERVYGLAAAKVVGMDVRDLELAPPGHEQETVDLLEGAMRGEVVRGQRAVRRRPSGDEVNVAITVSPIRDDEGVVVGVSAIVRDVSEAVRAEQALRESEEKYRALVEFAPDGVLLLGADRRYVDVNPAMCRLLGYTREEILGMTPNDLVVPEERPRLGSARRRALHGGVTVGVWHMRKKDEGVIEVEIAGRLLPDGRALAHVRDLSERREAEARLRESEARYRAVVDEATDGIFVAAWDGRYTEVNAQGAAMLGYAREELLGKTILDFVDAREAGRLAADREAVYAGETVGGDWSMRRKDGSWIDVEVRSKRLPDGRWLGLTRDVTERKQLVRALETARDAERDMRRQLEQWSSIVAHDLRQPLSIIELTVPVLEREAGRSDAERRALERLRKGCSRLKRMIGDLLDVSRLEASKLKLVCAPLDLPALVEEVVEEGRLLFAGANVRIERRDPLSPVVADATRVEQILLNLLSNAVKYGRREEDIVVGLERMGDDAVVSVTNGGHGLRPEEQAQLFERFHRAPGALQGQQEGLGLGLYITKGLVEAHGGHIFIESIPDETTTFRFTLPLATAHDERAAPRDLRPSA